MFKSHDVQRRPLPVPRCNPLLLESNPTPIPAGRWATRSFLPTSLLLSSPPGRHSKAGTNVPLLICQQGRHVFKRAIWCFHSHMHAASYASRPRQRRKIISILYEHPRPHPPQRTQPCLHQEPRKPAPRCALLLTLKPRLPCRADSRLQTQI